MRAWIAVAVAVSVCAFSVPAVSAQEFTCTASPRLLLVTVVLARMTDFQNPDNKDSPFNDTVYRTGPRLLDRCQGGGDMSFRGLLEEERTLGARSHLTVVTSSGRFGYEYFVTESIHEICAVLADCADATVRNAPPQ